MVNPPTPPALAEELSTAAPQGSPTGKTFDTWREHDSSIEPATQAGLRTLEWVGRAENLAVSGPSGTGKSHFVEALAHAVIDDDMRVVLVHPGVPDHHDRPGPRRRFDREGRRPDLQERSDRDR